MPTFARIHSITARRWDDPSAVVWAFDRPESSEEKKRTLFPSVLAWGKRSPGKTPAPKRVRFSSGAETLFRMLEAVDFSRDSDLLVRSTTVGGRVYVRHDGFYQPVISTEAGALEAQLPWVLAPAEYQKLISLVGRGILQKTYEFGQPFDGSSEFEIAGVGPNGETIEERISIRVSALPSLGSWSLCFRFIPVLQELRSLEEVYPLRSFREILRQKLLVVPSGLLLLAGPTGHGKTTAAYSMLGHLTSPANGILRHVVTIEDPIECRFNEVTQIEINPDGKFGFEEAFRGALRHGPEIFFFGEIRTAKAAHAAVQASLSGHYTLATIHGGSTFDVVSRLLGFGITARELSSALVAIINHRLVPRLCSGPNCSYAIDLSMHRDHPYVRWLEDWCWDWPAADLEAPSENNVRSVRPEPECPICGGRGAEGRVLIAGIDPNTDDFRSWLLRGAPREGAPGQSAPGPISPDQGTPRNLSFAACAAGLAARGYCALEEACRCSQNIDPESM